MQFRIYPKYHFPRFRILSGNFRMNSVFRWKIIPFFFSDIRQIENLAAKLTNCYEVLFPRSKTKPRRRLELISKCIDRFKKVFDIPVRREYFSLPSFESYGCTLWRLFILVSVHFHYSNWESSSISLYANLSNVQNSLSFRLFDRDIFADIKILSILPRRNSRFLNSKWNSESEYIILFNEI